MNYTILGNFLKQDSNVKDILGEYTGPYSIGITLQGEVLALRLRVTEGNFPEHVMIGDETVPLVVSHDFVQPTAL